MQTVLPREEAVEGVISKVLESQEACDRLNEVFYEHLENYQEINDDGDRHFAEVLLQAYKNGDVSALLLPFSYSPEAFPLHQSGEPDSLLIFHEISLESDMRPEADQTYFLRTIQAAMH